MMPPLLLQFSLLPSWLLPLPSTFDKCGLGITFLCLRGHPFAFPRSVETLLSGVAHKIAFRFLDPSFPEPRHILAENENQAVFSMTRGHRNVEIRTARGA